MEEGAAGVSVPVSWRGRGGAGRSPTGQAHCRPRGHPSQHLLPTAERRQVFADATAQDFQVS